MVTNILLPCKVLNCDCGFGFGDSENLYISVKLQINARCVFGDSENLIVAAAIAIAYFEKLQTNAVAIVAIAVLETPKTSAVVAAVCRPQFKAKTLLSCFNKNSNDFF